MKISLVLFLIFLFIFTGNVEAKVLPQAKSGKATTVKTTGSGINVSPRLRADRRALNVNFGSLQNAKAVSYALTYATSEQAEGAMGALKLDGSTSTSQELLFGTCSKNICRYHVGISSMKLEVSYISNSDKKYIKKYKIKV